MMQIAPRIWRVPPEDEPLSADAFIIEGDSRCYVFDVGAGDAAFTALSALDKPVTAILSHFHADHIGNMARLAPEVILAGARTCKYVLNATLVDAPIVLRDGVEILVQPCVSPHAPGCLIATVDGTYTLLGDLSYARPGVGQGEAKGMLNVLKALHTQYFVPSHVKGDPLQEKSAFLRDVKEYFCI